MAKYLNETGLAHYDSRMKERLAKKADISALPIKLSDLTNDARFITAADAEAFALKSDLASVYRYKGSVENYASLPMEENTVGDVWNVEATDMNYGWTGSAWDPLGQLFQIDAITNTEIDAIVDAG